MIGEIAVGRVFVTRFLHPFCRDHRPVYAGQLFFGPGMARGGAALAQQQTFIVAMVIFILANPGRTLGLDGLLFSGGGKGKEPR